LVEKDAADLASHPKRWATEIMKTYLLLLVGVLLGGVAAFWTFAMLFNTPVAKIFPTVLLPLGLGAAASFVLAWVDPNHWKVLAASVALPTLLMAAMLFILLWMESRKDWGWVLVAGAALCVCIIPSWVAHTRRTKEPNI
jgi:hypothetical protein